MLHSIERRNVIGSLSILKEKATVKLLTSTRG